MNTYTKSGMIQFIKMMKAEDFYNQICLICEFFTDNYSSYAVFDPATGHAQLEIEESVVYGPAYVVACFFAQRYNAGVEAETVVEELQLTVCMPVVDRMKLITAFASSF